MRLYFAAVLFLLFCVAVGKAQTSNNLKYDVVSFELGKTGIFYSVNFDRKFQNKHYGFRISVGSSLAKYITAYSAGGGGYYLLGKKNHHVELGVDLQYLTVNESSDDQRGVVLFYPDYPVKTYYASMNIGYRHYGNKNMFRIGIAPGFIKEGYLPGGYVSFGFIIR